MNKTILCVLIVGSVLLFFATQVIADDEGSSFPEAHRDFFQLLGPSTTELTVRYLFQPETQDEDGPSEFDLHQFQGTLDFPVPVSSDSYYRFGGEYQLGRYDFTNAGVGNSRLDEEDLHKIELSFGMGTFLNEEMLITGSLTPGIYSDMNGGLDEDDFKFQGMGMLVYRMNPTAQLLAGIKWSEDFDDYPLFPILGMRLLSENGLVHLNLTLPLEARLGYNFSTNAQAYTGFWISGDEYQVSFDQDDEFHLQNQERRFGVGVLVWLNDRIQVSIEGGALMGGVFEFKKENPGQFEDEVDPTGYLAGSLGLAF